MPPPKYLGKKHGLRYFADDDGYLVRENEPGHYSHLSQRASTFKNTSKKRTRRRTGKRRTIKRRTAKRRTSRLTRNSR